MLPETARCPAVKEKSNAASFAQCTTAGSAEPAPLLTQFGMPRALFVLSKAVPVHEVGSNGAKLTVGDAASTATRSEQPE